MKKLFCWFASLLLLLTALIVLIPFLVPAERFKQPIITLLEQETGRTVRLDGPIHLSLFPNIALSVEDAGLGNSDWAGTKEMFSAKTLRLGVKLMPLFSKRVELTGIELQQPVVNLVRNGSRANWQFDSVQNTQTKPAHSKDSGNNNSTALKLSTIAITGGQVNFRDLDTKEHYQLSQVDVKVTAESLSDDASIKGSFTYNTHPFKIDARIGSIVEALLAKGTKFSLAFNTDGIGLNWNGTMSLADQTHISGPIALDTDNLSALSPFDKNVPPEFQDINLNGSLDVTQTAKGTIIKLNDGKVTLNNKDADANLIIALVGTPQISGSIKMAKLDITPYMESPATGTGETSGPTQSSKGWSDKKIDFSGLSAANMDLIITIDELIAKNAVLKPVALKLALNGGQLKAQLAPAGFYDGTISGVLSLSADSSLAINGQMQSINTEKLLTDFADFKRLSGTLQGAMNVSSNGESQRALVSHLSGAGHVKFTDGSIKGINLAAMLRNVASAFTEQETSGHQTDFSELSGSYTIASGVVTNHDLTLKSPLLRVTGDGEVNLPPRTVNYLLKPELVATLEGQGGKDVGGIKVPVRVEGTFDELHFRPDLKATLEEGIKNPENIKNTVKGVEQSIKDLKKGGLNSEGLKGLLGR